MMKVLVRTDASAQIGSGHLMRCAALAHALRNGEAKVTFAMRQAPPAMEELVRSQGHGTLRLPEISAPRIEGWLAVPWESDASQTLAALEAQGGVDWLVVDHYGIDFRWEERVRAAGCKVLVIDDLAISKHSCDVLLNQNLVANAEERYRPLVPSACRLMLGPKFALLREEFRAARAVLSRDPQRMNRVLVFLGGGDPDGVTLTVLAVVDAVRPGGLEVSVVIGANNPHRNAIEQLYARRDGYQVITQTPHMAQVMVEADLAVGAGGVSTWERCCLGLPAVVLAIAENQQEVSLAASEAGACIFLGPSTEVTPETLEASLRVVIGNAGVRKMLSEAGAKLVDGLGCQRVARIMLQRPLHLRPARAEDAKRLFEWRNAEPTRRHFHDPSPLTLQGHMRWFRDCLNDDSRALLIGEDGGLPVGVLRYDFGRSVATVSIYLDPALHGHGYGPQLLLAGEQWLQQTKPEVVSVRAEIAPANDASRSAFEEAGFRASGLLFDKALRIESAFDRRASAGDL